MSTELLNAQSASRNKFVAIGSTNNISVSGNSKRKLKSVSKHLNMRNKGKKYATTLDSTYGERLNSSAEYQLNKNSVLSTKKKVTNMKMSAPLK